MRSNAEDTNGRNGKGKGKEGGASGDKFSVLPHEIPALPQDLVLKEFRLKSTSMLALKKEIEVELPLQIAGNILDEDEPTVRVRARFEARLAKPQSECVTC